MYGSEVFVLFILNKLKENHVINHNNLVRDEDFFLTIDLVYKAAVKIGVDPMNPRLTITNCKISKTGVTFASGATVQWNELGLGNLRRVDDLFSEYVEGLPNSTTEFVKPDFPFLYSPNKAEWYFKESANKRLFEKWARQLAVGANIFVL